MSNQKRKQGEGTVRLRTDGRWEGRVVIGYDEKGFQRQKAYSRTPKTRALKNLQR